MKCLYYIVTRPFWRLLHMVGLTDEAFYKQQLKLYYYHKTTLTAVFRNIFARGRVKRYFNLHVRNAKTVIYTCLTGGYDELIIHRFLNPECDYVCFSDDKEMIAKRYVGPWKIEPLRFDKLDNGKNNRWHKMHPHVLFPSYQTSLYVDSNVNFCTGKIFEYIRSIPRKCYIAVPRHASRDCIYEEARFVMENNIDKAKNVRPLLEKYYKERFPEHFGLGENNVIFRKHHNPSCMLLMEDWWEIFNRYSKRDQLSLFYLIWKEKVDFAFFAPNSFKKDHKNFRIYKHKG